MTISPVWSGPSSSPASFMMATSGPAASSHGSRNSPLRGQRIAGHLVRGLGHAVGLDQGSVERRLDRLDHLGRHGRGGRAHKPQRVRGDHIPIVGRPGEDRLVHGRHGRVPGRPALAHPGEEPQGIEARRAEDQAAGIERRQQTGHQAVDVEEGHDVQPAILGA